MLFDMKCPSCGATMKFDDSRDSMFCPYCGGRVTNLAEQVNINQNINVSGTVVHVQDRSNEPNLYISYNTNNPGVGMVTRIVTTGVKNTYVNGQTLTYHLNQGSHTIILKIGKKNYSRNIVIPQDNSPVRIYASFNGRAQISIDQPNASPIPATVQASVHVPASAPVVQQPIQVNQQTPVAQQPVQAQSTVAQTSIPQVQTQTRAPGKPKAPLSILAFILSLTFYLSWAGAALGTVEVFVLDKKKEKNHIFSYIAMGIGTFFTLCMLFGLTGSGKNTETTTVSSEIETVIETTTETETTESSMFEEAIETAIATTTTAATTAATEPSTTTTEATTAYTTSATEANDGLYYTSNGDDDYKDGDHGVYAYSRNAGSYNIYIIIDFDEGYIYYFCHGNGDEICDRCEIDSGDLNSLCFFIYHFDDDEDVLYAVCWSRTRQPNHLLFQSEYGESWDYYPEDLDYAISLRDSKEIVDY